MRPQSFWTKDSKTIVEQKNKDQKISIEEQFDISHLTLFDDNKQPVSSSITIFYKLKGLITMNPTGCYVKQGIKWTQMLGDKKSIIKVRRNLEDIENVQILFYAKQGGDDEDSMDEHGDYMEDAKGD